MKYASNAEWSNFENTQDLHHFEKDARAVCDLLLLNYGRFTPCPFRGICLHSWVSEVGIKQAMRKAFNDLLSLSPEELKDTLKKATIGPVGQLYRLLEGFEFINECSDCEFYRGKTPRCRLPSLTSCPRAEDNQ